MVSELSMLFKLKGLKMNARKKTDLRLTFYCLLLSLVLFVFPGQGLSDIVKVNISPFKIILNADGSSDDIQAKIPMALPAGEITDFEASLLIGDADEILITSDFYYCAIDNILHIYFDRKTVLDYLKDNEIEGKGLIAEVWGSFYVGDEYVEFEGDDIVEVLDPDHRNQVPK